MKTLRILLHLLMAVAHLAVVVLFILSAVSDHISPEDSLFFSYLGLAFPVLLLLNLFFILYWVSLGKWRFVLVALFAFVVCLEPIRHYIPLHKRVKDLPRENVVKVLTYNVMAFGYKNHTKRSPNKIIEYIVRSDADIVCLQEYAESKIEKGLTGAKIYEALSMYPYRSVIIFGSSKVQRIGIAVFSKYPILSSRRVEYDSRHNGSSVHVIDVKGKQLTLINNHLESFKLTMEDRSRYSTFIKNLGAEGLDELRGAFQQKLGPAFQIRARQAEAVAKEVEKAKEGSILVCGDFNDTPISYAHRTIQGDYLTDAFAESGKGLGVTYNQNFFLFRIDHILHSSDLSAMNCTVDKVKYSDHYPLWCYIRY